MTASGCTTAGVRRDGSTPARTLPGGTTCCRLASSHAELARVDPVWSAALDARTSPWAVADRVAWGEAPIPARLAGRTRAVVERALDRAEGGEDRAVQIIHGDLAGNVLFPSTGRPVIIDLSPYRRPVGHATAIAVVDQICWHGAGPSRVALAGAADLARAVVFRIVAAGLQSTGAGEAEAARAGGLVIDRLPEG